MASAIRLAGSHLRELRIHLCQKSPASDDYLRPTECAFCRRFRHVVSVKGPKAIESDSRATLCNVCRSQILRVSSSCEYFCRTLYTSTGTVEGTVIVKTRVRLLELPSAGVRAFVESDYVALKKANPQFPILIRECSGIVPRVFARYEHGVERCVVLEDLSKEKVASAIRELSTMT